MARLAADRRDRHHGASSVLKDCRRIRKSTDQEVLRARHQDHAFI